MNKVIWYLKQLFPLCYNTEYIANNKKMVSTWKMWLGRCYGVREYEVMNTENRDVFFLIENDFGISEENFKNTLQMVQDVINAKVGTVHISRFRTDRIVD